MKTRDSGMPEEASWSMFFDPAEILRALGLITSSGRVIDIGCGYGTFTFPVARLTGKPVLAMDIEPQLVEAIRQRARDESGITVQGVTRDVVVDGMGEPDASAGLVLLFNLLHCEDPSTLLRETWRVLHAGGRVGVIHWRSDISTPRGPALSIRPRPEAIERWLIQAGFEIALPAMLLPPFHFGVVGRKPASTTIQEGRLSP